MMIRGKFGIIMSDGGQKNWTAQNLHLMFISLQTINHVLNNKIRSFVAGVLFKVMKQNPKEGQYHGITHEDGSSIDFYTIGDDAIRQMNIYHEFGHLLDNVPSLKDVFTNAVTNEGSPSWVTNGKVNEVALISSDILDDPNYSKVQAIQAYSNPGSSEVWADAFANLVAGNIDLGKTEGHAMNTFVTGALAQYISKP